MTAEGERDRRGRFRRGVSGNPAGRPRRQVIPETPHSRRRVILGVADETIEATVGGKLREMSVFEANVRAISVMGARGNRMAAQAFVTLVQRQTEIDMLARIESQRVADYIERLRRDSERLHELTAQPTSGVVHVPVQDINDWDPQKALDDWHGIRKAIIAAGPLTAADDDPADDVGDDPAADDDEDPEPGG